jgi:amino acid adenylation domain-containing protein
MTEAQIQGYACSPQQRRLWSLMRADAEQRHVVKASIAINGPVDEASLISAWRRIVERHEVLRCRFVHLPGMVAPLQSVGTQPDDAPRVIDVAGLASAEHAAEVSRRLEQLAAAPFELDRGPLVRGVLLRFGDNHRKLLIVAAAMILDAESIAAILRQLALELGGGAAANAVFQYVDYASWRDALLESPDDVALRTYWLRPLAADRQVVAGIERAANPMPARRSVVLHDGTVEALRRLSLASGVAFADVMMAAWAVFLARRAGTEETLFDRRFDGRFHSELAGAVGRYAQHLPVRMSCGADTVFTDVLAAAAAEVKSAAAHQDYAELDRIDAGTVVGTHPARGAFSIFESPVACSASGSTLTLEDIDECDSRYGSGMEIITAADKCRCRLIYDAERMPTAAADRLLDGWMTLLDDVAARPHVRIGDLAVCGVQERRWLVETLNATRVDYDGPELIHVMFDEQAERTPEAVAVRCGGDTLTYRQLRTRAERLAAALRGRDDLPDDGLVPVLLCRTPNLLVAVLGILKAGLAYVPLDPSQPAHRIGLMLEGLTGSLAVCGADLAHLLPARFAAISVNTTDESAAPSASNRTAAGSPEGIAYVLFTSGSTGRPKGVIVSHRSLANYVRFACARYGLASGRGALVHTSVAFDLTVTTLLAPLTIGQQVILLPEVDALGALAAALKDGADYTIVKATPSQVAALREMVPPERLAGSVRTLVIGGEALHGSTVADLHRHAPEMRVFNEYGPTEATVGCSVWEVDRQAEGEAVPIGHPIPNTTLYVLDAMRRPVPTGAAGELYVGGAGVATGYLDRRQMAERFLDDPFGHGRLYRTGDVVRHRPGGELEFLGRTDAEMKIRGFRIHPAEIEAALSAYPLIAEAVVIGCGDGALGQRLAAYYVAATDQPVQHDDLRRHLAERLPEPMLPAMFRQISAVPLTSNGKRDIAALPPIDWSPQTAAPAYAAPRTYQEEVLCAAYCNVFKLDRVGIDDNYFVLGGDSLRSVQVSAIAQRHGVSVSVPEIHRYPSVRALAAVIKDGNSLEAAPATTPFSLLGEADRTAMFADVEDAYPLNLLQQGMIYHREFSPKSAVYHAICSYRIRAVFDLGIMERVIESLVRRHPLLRTSFDLSHFSEPLQLVHANFRTPLRFFDLRGGDIEGHDAAVDQWIEHEKQRGFELEEYPLIRYCIHRLHDDVFQLSYSFHHEIIDGWSDAYMVTELLSHYLSLVHGQTYQPSRPAVTFRDSIVLEQTALATDQFRDFWTAELDGAQPMKLPRMIAPLRADKGEREIVKFEIPISPELSDATKRLAAMLAVPLKTVLLAAHIRVISAFGGGSDVLTYTVSNGRPENRDGDGVIGLFVNSLAFRLRLAGGSWADLIRNTLRKEHDLLPYRRYPMAEVKRQSGNEPLSETLFFFNHYHVADVLDQWRDAELLGIKVYGESTFPYCINAYLAPVSKRLGMRIEYDSLQYSAELMAAMQDAYLIVLKAMIADPNGRYDTISLFNDRDRDLIGRWNATTARFFEVAGIHRLVEAAAVAWPDRVAIASRTEQLSYAALNRRANRLARYLRTLGTRPGTTVGLCLERSAQMVVAILAVLKAGGAYVPVDPDHPKERMASIFADAQAHLVLTSAPLAGSVIALGDQVVRLDIEEPRLAEGEATNLAGPDIPDELAYVIYTSGSTGRPKGVQITHRALINSTLARGKFYREPADRFLLLSSYAFDSSVAGLFWTLCGGGTLILPGADALDLTELVRTVADQQVTTTLTIPSLYAALLQEQRTISGTALRNLIVAGEQCSKDIYQCHSRTLPQVRFFNEYGPTEATVWATAAEARRRTLGLAVPIGAPIANMQALVLDPFGQPTPVGVAGELHLAGVGLARGYHNAPGATARRFKPNPFGAPGDRMYATGDLVRWFPDCALEFLDRVDFQIKLNGFRIEVGEIEAVLESHPKVLRAVVQLHGEKGGERLIAYVLPSGVDAPAHDELARFVRDKLPKYMLPSQFVSIEKLPLTSTGKLDRKALPQPPTAVARSLAAIESPRTPTEEVLCAIWTQILGVPAIGVNDRFFDLGGESLRAMRIMARVRNTFQLELPLRMLMTENASISQLASAIEVARWTGRDAVPRADELATYEVGRA